MRQNLIHAKSSLKWFLKAFVVGLSATLFFYYGQNIPFEKQWSLYDSLRNTSAIIFGVMGAWIALIYPEALSSILDKSKNSETQDKSKDIEKLLSPLLYSTVILASVLLVGIFAPIIKQIPLFTSNYRLVRGISYAFLGFLTLFQLWAVILTLLPADIAKRNLNQLQGKKEVRKRLLSRTQKELDESDE